MKITMWANVRLALAPNGEGKRPNLVYDGEYELFDSSTEAIQDAVNWSRESWYGQGISAIVRIGVLHEPLIEQLIGNVPFEVVSDEFRLRDDVRTIMRQLVVDIDPKYLLEPLKEE